jgi:hypothetical protein
MDCVNHGGVSATAYCQSCGKGLCTTCAIKAPGGQVFCAPCAANWQSYAPPFSGAFPAGPNPATAGALGLIPGVGAMYNGQFLKGMIHVIVFAVLISITDHYHIFGLFIAAWVLYQAFEAYHTAKARREGLPLPDPFGLNELSSYLNLGSSTPYPPRNPASGAPFAGQPPVNPAAQATAGDPGTTGWQTPYTGQYPPPNGGPIPPIPPAVPFCWTNGTPIGAVILIGLGLLIFMDQFDFFSGRVFRFSWPLGLIALGVWLAVNRVGNSQGGSR